ncbi:MAG: D-2-hydroxyacid dehydrogenase [Verrucomicrobiota bacterium]
MKIVILDAYAANPGDLDWSALESLGDLTIHDRTPPEQVVERAAGAEVVLTNKALLPAEAISQLPDLKYIGVIATGVNIVDLEAAVKAGITVTNVPGYSTQSVAQLTFAFILELASRVAEHDAAVQAGDWIRSDDFSFTTRPLIELAGKRLGIIGYGDIGQAVAKIGEAMGMEVRVANRTPEKVPAEQRLALDEVFQTSDVVTLHCPLTPDTENLVDAARLKSMKPTAMLINTSRGPLVDEAALAEALRSVTIAAAGLDVLCAEPMQPDHPLLGITDCLITPHIAWASFEARERLIAEVAANLKAWVDGAPVNVIGD